MKRRNAQLHPSLLPFLSTHDVSSDSTPTAARIVAVADVFDVLTHSRPYKAAWPVEEALALMIRESGKHFDPRLVDFLNRLIGKGDLFALGMALQVSPQAAQVAAA